MKACVLVLCAAALIAGSYASPMQGLRVGKTFDGTAYDFISSQSNLKTLTAAINAAGLQSTLSGSGTFTIFAPQDSAFSSNNMADYKVKYLLDSKHKTNLQSLLEYHVIGKEYRSSDLTDQLSVSESLNPCI